MINYNFTAVIQAWLDAAPEDRDLRHGAMLLLQLDQNRIRYNNIMRDPQRHEKMLESELRRHFEQRAAIPTEEQKEAIRKEARELLEEHTSLKEDNPAAQFRAGKRADHDALPAEIRALYEKNLELRHAMQQYHLQIRTLLKSKKDCAPEDLRDLCSLLRDADKKYRANWKQYDSYSY